MPELATKPDDDGPLRLPREAVRTMATSNSHGASAKSPDVVYDSVALFTIHGIDPDPWQDALDPVLSPHVQRHVALKYSGYNGKKGALKLVRGHRYRKKVAEDIHTLFYSEKKTALRSRIVAHSYGTVVITDILERFTGRKFDRMIFLGSAVSRTFDWGMPSLLEHSWQLTNSYGTKDEALPWARGVNIFSKLPLIGKWLVCDLVGDAGRVGFKGSPDLVHNVDAPMSSCGTCDGKPYTQRTRVHNIRLNGAYHSDHFINPQYAEEMLIPTLFGLTPKRYTDFLELCNEARNYDKGHGSLSVNPHEKSLLDFKLEYEDFDNQDEGGILKTIREQIRTLLEKHFKTYQVEAPEPDREAMIPLIVKAMWTAVCTASDNRTDSDKAPALLPRKAIQRAILSLLKTSNSNEARNGAATTAG